MTEEFAEFPDVVSPEDLQKMLGIGRASAYRLLHTGEIHHIRIGKKFIIPKRCVIEFLRNTPSA